MGRNSASVKKPRNVSKKQQFINSLTSKNVSAAELDTLQCLFDLYVRVHSLKQSKPGSTNRKNANSIHRMLRRKTDKLAESYIPGHSAKKRNHTISGWQVFLKAMRRNKQFMRRNKNVNFYSAASETWKAMSDGEQKSYSIEAEELNNNGLRQKRRTVKSQSLVPYSDSETDSEAEGNWG